MSALTIGALVLSPEFSPDTLEYSVTTSNATNKVTATAKDSMAEVVIKLGEAVINNESSPTWVSGENTITVIVTNGISETMYTVIVTKI